MNFERLQEVIEELLEITYGAQNQENFDSGMRDLAVFFRGAYVDSRMCLHRGMVRRLFLDVRKRAYHNDLASNSPWMSIDLHQDFPDLSDDSAIAFTEGKLALQAYPSPAECTGSITSSGPRNAVSKPIVQRKVSKREGVTVHVAVGGEILSEESVQGTDCRGVQFRQAAAFNQEGTGWVIRRLTEGFSIALQQLEVRKR